MKILKTRLPDNGVEYRVSFREIKSSVDTNIQFSWFSRKKRQNHKYHYAEHMFVCQEQK